MCPPPWVIRDTEERGYKYNVVLDTINKRKLDSDKIRKEQIGHADVIIKIIPEKNIVCLGDKNEKINLSLSFVFKKEIEYAELFDFIKKYFIKYNEFIEYSELIGKNIELCQNGGGNFSIKISDNYMIIKSSGYSLKDAYKFDAYSLINFSKIKKQFSQIMDDNSYNLLLQESIISKKYKRPSMETGFHIELGSDYILHVHPIYLTLILCLDESEKIINKLYGELEYHYIKYFSPGYRLFDQIRDNKIKNICFLENHGLILSANNIQDIVKLLDYINDVSKKYIESKCNCQNFSLLFSQLKPEKRYAFPDSVLFINDLSKEEIIAAHNYINTMGPQVGKIRYLTQQQINYIKNLESEKYRKTL